MQMANIHGLPMMGTYHLCAKSHLSKKVYTAAWFLAVSALNQVVSQPSVNEAGIVCSGAALLSKCPLLDPYMLCPQTCFTSCDLYPPVKLITEVDQKRRQQRQQSRAGQTAGIVLVHMRHLVIYADLQQCSSELRN